MINHNVIKYQIDMSRQRCAGNAECEKALRMIEEQYKVMKKYASLEMNVTFVQVVCEAIVVFREQKVLEGGLLFILDQMVVKS